MNFVIFCPHYPPYVGGLETHAQEFNHYLAEKAEVHQIVVVTAWDPVSSQLEEVVGDKILILRVPVWNVIPNFPVPQVWSPLYWRVLRRARTSRPDIVISRTRFFVSSALAGWYARRWGARWVHIEHGSDFVQLSSPVTNLVARIYDYTVGRWIFRSSDVVIGISYAVANFVHHFTLREVSVIYRGLSIDRQFSTAKPASLPAGIAKRRSKIIFVGRLIDNKGVPDLLQAVAELDKQDVALIIVGDGPQRARIERLIRELDLDRRVWLAGSRTPHEVVSLLKAANVFVNPSYTEGLPTSVLEAAYSDVPIIATDVGGTREIVTHGKTGRLVQPHKPKLLARSIVQVLDNPEEAMKMSIELNAFVRERFDWRVNIEAYYRLFLAILPGKSQKGEIVCAE